MSGTVIPDPRGGHVWIYGVDSEGNPVKVLVDADGRVQVYVGDETQSGLELLLAEMQLKADQDETQPVSAASLPLPDGATTEATLATLSTEATLELARVLLASLDGKDFATQTTLAAILAAQVNRAATPVVYNVTMTNANTEYSQALPANAKKFLIKCRGAFAVKVCFTSEESGATYLTIPAGMAYYEDLIQPSSLTLYFQCATAAQVAEIVAWS